MTDSLPSSESADFDNLRRRIEELIGEYNRVYTHRIVGIVDGFGQEVPWGKSTIKPYVALWDDDIKSTHAIGFVCHDNDATIRSFGSSDVRYPSLEDAFTSFEKQLRDIPELNSR